MTAATICEPVTVADIDEALGYAAGSHHRDSHWRRWVDALLDQRLRITAA